MLHLGRNLTVSEKTVVAILGMQSGRTAPWTRSFTAVRVGNPPYKSMILTHDGRLCRLIYSPVSPSTLRSRIECRHALSPAGSPDGFRDAMRKERS